MRSTTPPLPGLYAVPSLATYAANHGISPATPVVTASSPTLFPQAIPLRDSYPNGHKIETRDPSSTGELFELPPEEPSFGRWGVEILYSLQIRDMWPMPEAFSWCQDIVCDPTQTLTTMCNSTSPGDKIRYKPQNVTCDWCWPTKDTEKIEAHCREIAKRFAIMFTVLMALLLASCTGSLIVWLLIILRTWRRRRPDHRLRAVNAGPGAARPRWYRRVCRGSCKDEEAEQDPKRTPNVLNNKRPRKMQTLVPIMPPAHSANAAPFRQPLNWVDDNSPDIEFGLTRKSSGRSTHPGIRAVSSGTHRSPGHAANRRPSVRKSTHGAEANVSGPSRSQDIFHQHL